MREIIVILSSVFIAYLIALAGSYNGFSVFGYPLIFHCLLIAFGIQLIVFIPSYIFTTEKFFDLTGMITFLGIMTYIFYIRGLDVLNHTGLIFNMGIKIRIIFVF